ncbi:SMI1/KNR4 family protein [Paenibacillus gorillae]|uniref:SMI1/KNR4 family protein n=1 Tax=Paenibacillus gorillae TaxID=1243662 RepID=UPI0004B3C748|nr:SMI1/KNR4 family protein [Paenibacillus gorillae]
MSDWNLWEQRLISFIDAIEHIGGEAGGYKIKPPADLGEIKKIEEQLGQRLPQSFVRVMTEFSRGMEVYWSLPDEDLLSIPLPEELQGLFASNFSWDIDEILSIEEARRGWVTEVFPDPNDPYDSVWHNKLAFMEVGNGDYLAFDLAFAEDSPIIYLSHDDGEGHGFLIGNNFIDFFNKWTQIGCVGCEDWQLLPFIKDSKSGIDPLSENAVLWRSWLGNATNIV